MTGTIDPTLVLAIIVAAQLAIQLDCNRRVRELQRNSDLQMRWLDAIAAGREIPEREQPPQRASPRARNRYRP